MLDGMRKAAQTWLGKAVLTIMFSFLILSFAVWGIGDIFRGFGQGKVARAGATDISAEEFRFEYQSQLQRLQQMTRQAITNDQARAFGLDQQVLQQMVAEALLDQRARELGLAMSEDSMREAVFKDPAFAGPNGAFDRTTFLDRLRNANMDERRFAAKLRTSYLRQELSGSLIAGVKLPQAMLESVFRYASETRSIEYFALDAAAAGEIAAPSTEELAKFFETNKLAWRAPEYRKFVTLALSPAMVAKPQEVTDADISARYERVKTQKYGTPETRQIYQIVFKSGEEKEAAEALAKIRGGAKFEDVAGERQLKLSDIDLGVISIDKMADAAVAKAAFSLKEGETSDVIVGRFGPVVVQAVKVTPAVVKPLDEVKDELRNEIALERAPDEIQKLQNRIEDQRTSGKDLIEAAKAAGLSARVIEAADANGRDKEGKEIEGLPDREQLLKAVFASDIGVDNETLQTRERGYVWFEISGIEPARERKLDEVRAQVEAAWKADQVSAKLREKAEALVKEITAGKSVEDAAKSVGVAAEHINDAKRGGHPKLPAAVIERVFSVPVGTAASAISGQNARVVFKVLDSAIPAFDPDNETVKSITPQIENAFISDIGAQYLAQIQKEAGVTVNTAALRSATGATDGN